MLRLKLKLMARQRQGLQGLLQAEPHGDEKTEDLQKELAEIGARFRKLQTTLTNLENYVPHLNKILGHPEQYLSLQDVSLRLNRMNVLVTAPTQERCTSFLNGSDVADGRRFVLLFVKCTRDQLRPQRALFDEAARLL